MKAIIKFSLVTSLWLCPLAALATPVPLPFTYPYETLQQGEIEDELYGDMTPLRVQADPTDPSKGRLWEPAYILQNELEFGLTDHLELAFYQVFEANPQDGGTNTTQFDGFKWRARIRLAEAGEWPLDTALYFELETLHDEWSLEEKVIFARRFGDWHWMANLWVEESLERPFDSAQTRLAFVLNPTTGITYEVAPWFQPGVEYWARGELGTHGDTPAEIVNHRIHHFVGPTIHFNWGKLWWSLGVYADLNNTGKPELNESYGPLWARSLLGFNL